ncbi:hypothetical protein QFW77_01345 [Luteimonas sp. RD2P54]|uniref:DUF998 domain-containing protein n=1 Tax=Luteimonas endophytica TaxID=3042023 RepID=A0ABT6J496_9GAMM|nr:hypothetical protein [Luteimonas endophytica]MDH5821640.1 hypothetical protein [Luteimonas endophytica]
MASSRIPLWPVPLAIAITLVVAAHLAWWISVQAGHIPFCVPYVEGCTSISRAARHGLGNQLFRLLVLPCALLVGLHWWLAARWLRLRGGRGAAAMAALAWLAALSLGVYATFLGTEGEAYRFLRRYGVVVFFGCSYLAQVLFLRLAGEGAGLDRVSRSGMTAVCVAMLLLGVVHVVAAALIGGSALQDRLENALEWHLGVLLVGWYLLHARLWGGERYRLAIERGSSG